MHFPSQIEIDRVAVLTMSYHNSTTQCPQNKNNNKRKKRLK